MKFNMLCIKFDQIFLQTQKPKFWTFEFFKVFKNLKKPSFFRSHFPALIGCIGLRPIGGQSSCLLLHGMAYYTVRGQSSKFGSAKCGLDTPYRAKRKEVQLINSGTY